MAQLIESKIAVSAKSAEAVFTALTGDDRFSVGNADQRVTFLLKNANATQNASVVFKAGDGALSSEGDVTIAVGAGKLVAVPLARLESARVKSLGGGNRGGMEITSSVDAGGTLANVSLSAVSVL